MPFLDKLKLNIFSPVPKFLKICKMKGCFVGQIIINNQLNKVQLVVYFFKFNRGKIRFGIGEGPR